jgi:hypothetical protein
MSSDVDLTQERQTSRPAKDAGPRTTPAVEVSTTPAQTKKTGKAKGPSKPTADAATQPEAEPKEKKPRIRLAPSTRLWLRDMGAMSVSAIVHALVVIVLALVVLPLPEAIVPTLLTATPTREEELTPELDLKLDPAETPEVTEAASEMGMAAAVADLAAPELPALEELLEPQEGPSVSVTLADISPASKEAMASRVPDGAPGEPSSVVDDYAEALDRLTYEILAMMNEGPVLVMWLFDQSDSMKDDQQEIRGRVEKVYLELGITEKTRNDPLLSAVCSYGGTWRMHTQRPTADYLTLAKAIDQVPNDPSGEEIMCTAIGQTIQAHQRYSNVRQMALILVTDESGNREDNIQNLEAAIALAKQTRTRVFVLGREAVFGYPYAHMKWVDPETKLDFWRRIDRGPETPAVEGLQTNGFYRRYDAHASGFGPYEQVRLARETGGVFFLLPSPETNLVRGDNRKYELEAMRPYLPYLGTRQSYLQMITSSPLRTKLTQLILALNPYDKNQARYVNMRHQFSLNPVEFAQQSQQEQAKAKEYILFLESQIVEMDSYERLRNEEDSQRWKANYDLIRAQLIAYRVRLYEYGLYLEEFRNNFQKHLAEMKRPSGTNRTTHWELRLRRELLSGDRFQEDIARANKLFDEIIANHPGTPWASRADYEKRRGYGVHLVEDRDDPRRPMVKLPNL